jgi:hypothetical protein
MHNFSYLGGVIGGLTGVLFVVVAEFAANRSAPRKSLD